MLGSYRGRLPAVIVSILVVLSVGLAHPARAAILSVYSGASGPQTLVIAAPQALSDLDPATSYDGPSAGVLRGVYEGLVRLKGKNPMQPQGTLAASWSSSQGNKVWTFHLRHNVHFHDGTLLTAPGVKAWMDHVQTVNEGPAFIVGQFVQPPRIKAVNRYTLQFTLKSPSDVFPRALAAEWGN